MGNFIGLPVATPVCEFWGVGFGTVLQRPFRASGLEGLRFMG